MDYFHVQMLAILSTHARQSTSHFSANQLPQNLNKNYVKPFIKHLVGIRENSKSKDKQGRLRSKEDLITIKDHNFNYK